jgi:hypothetical protein
MYDNDIQRWAGGKLITKSTGQNYKKKDETGESRSDPVTVSIQGLGILQE